MRRRTSTTSCGEVGRPRFRAAREAFIDRLLDVRAQVDSFLDESVEHIASCRPRLVGFTSVFQQQVASLALAKRLKEKCPGIFVVFGGANCEGVMGAEVVRQFPFVDAVVSGEGDLHLPRAGAAGAARRTGVRSDRCVYAPEHRRVGPERWVRECAAGQGSRRTPDPGLRRLLRSIAREPAGSSVPGVHHVRDVQGLLVGRAEPLHVLRSQRCDHAVSGQVGAPRRRRARPPDEPVSWLRGGRRRLDPERARVRRLPAGARGAAAGRGAVLRGQGQSQEGAGPAAPRRWRARDPTRHRELQQRCTRTDAERRERPAEHPAPQVVQGVRHHPPMEFCCGGSRTSHRKNMRAWRPSCRCSRT